jgi:hypothetical protein
MGVSGLSCSISCFDDLIKEKPRTIIDPYEFKVLDLDNTFEPYCILLIKYKCDSFNGLKLAVYEDFDIDKNIINKDVLDPHFSELKSEISPIARFRPTEKGLDMALSLCEILFKQIPNDFDISELQERKKHSIRRELLYH